MVSVAKGELPVGFDLGGHAYEITPDLVRQYEDGIDDHDARYASIAPALLLHSECYKFGGWYLSIWGNLHARQEFELFAPMPIGDNVTTRAMVIDRYSKRGRDYVVNEVQVFGQDGRLVSRGRTHQSFVQEAQEGLAVDKDREKSAERRFEIGEGDFVEAIPALEKQITTSMLKTFSPGVSYHNDAEQAKKLGFPDIVVQGMMPICFVSELMTKRFGDGWYEGGRMDVRLVNVLWGGDGTATARGVIRDFVPEGARRRANCEVWVEKPDGTKVIVGTASAVVP
jgi:acyl dehydratase